MRARSYSHLFAVLPFVILSLALGACEERVSEPGVHLIVVPEHQQATIGDTLQFLGIFTGAPGDVARHSWDFNSDGIFDYVWENFGDEGDSVFVVHVYNHPDEYTATFQVATVQNRLYRATSPVTITDQVPTIRATLPDSVACGETFEISGTAIDDAGRRAFWDIGGEGSSEFSEEFTDSVTLTEELSFDEPGHYTLVFGASDNDGHLEKLEFELVVGVPPAWSPGAEMSEARADFAAVAAGGLIYAFGGRHGRGVVTSVEIYDPVADDWSFGSSLPTPRWGARAVERNGDIYVIGGVTQADTVFPQVEVYHPDTDTWTTFDPGIAKHVMPIAKRGFAALRVGGQTAFGDSIMVMGGMAGGAVNDTTLFYYMANDSFSVDVAPTHFPHQGNAWLSAVTVWDDDLQLDGRIFTVGGTQDGASPNDHMESYDPAFDFWRTEQAMPTARIAPASVYLDGMIYVLGGGEGATGAIDVGEVYSLQRERWDALPPLPEARSGAAAVELGGRIYLVAGATAITSPYHVEGSRSLQILEPWRCAP